jgi:hypothetical protein
MLKADLCRESDRLENNDYSYNNDYYHYHR